MGWFSSVEHTHWLSNQLQGLLAFGRRSAVPQGFGYIEANGEVDPERPLDLYLNARMTWAFAVGVMLGVPGCRRYADHGVRCLTQNFGDPQYGGWYAQIMPQLDENGQAVPTPGGGDRKEAYGHAHVMLAAATATAANRMGANELLMAAMENQDRYWWDPEYRLVRESYDRTFKEQEEYRGANANMHTMEAYLACADATSDAKWLNRAVSIADYIINKQARQYDWFIPEHYTPTWEYNEEYNKDKPDDQFRPWGATVGHALEWSRLVLQARATLKRRGLPVPEWLLDAAESLFENARTTGWRVDGRSGFVYTTDFAGKPLVTKRLHWVLCEGISATVALRRTYLDEGRGMGEVEHFDHCYRSWIDFAEGNFIIEPGRWNHELDEYNQPCDEVWPGHPDIYHSLQAMLLPRLPISPCIGVAVGEGYLDQPGRFSLAETGGVRRGFFRR